MDRDGLQARVKQFALRVIKLVEALPTSVAGREIGRQLLRSATSASANYRAARRARSTKEFIAKICIVVEETDESAHWLELIVEAELLPVSKVRALEEEAGELMRIFAATRATARRRHRQIAKSPDRQIQEPA